MKGPSGPGSGSKAELSITPLTLLMVTRNCASRANRSARSDGWAERLGCLLTYPPTELESQLCRVHREGAGDNPLDNYEVLFSCLPNRGAKRRVAGTVLREGEVETIS